MLKYEKERIIGNGSYGNVWLVNSQADKKKYVMKEIKLISMNAVERQQAMMEATLLSKCRHKNIIKYKDAIHDRPRKVLQIVMEYAEGGDLHSAIVRQKGIPFKEHTVISWFIQISLALQYIHFQNILHRDLKTQNIFLTLTNFIKIGDFGIARVLQDPTELATTAIGTPYYLSPEICQRKPYNYKSDMWALGCILFEMSALVHPFQAFSFPHLLTLILKGKRKELPNHCSPLIAELVDSLLCVNPNNRPSTDDILSRTELQPYLSEYLAIFDNDLISTHRSEGLQKPVQQHRLCEEIRDSAGSSGAKSERTKFENKLKDLFGVALFDQLYEALYSRWETRELEESESAVKTIIDSLNYKQIQSLPLMMQLIQLDILKK
ncbi:serine/threonine-protein kinase Nek4-like [Uloborus diversus]|uniref:serine/threonine-protein kinase Nek4-like n=1 Tax=Uloborus diversus TaxID=327109 RepID=UPI002409EBCD|nr:serine/threonine-protein kinase Nek4-like [Uloborus diversus]